MIVVEIRLVSAVSRDRDSELGTLILDNVTPPDKLEQDGGRACDYRARMFRKGALARAGNDPRKLNPATPTREATVIGHRRHAEPVQNLIAKALTALGYR